MKQLLRILGKRIATLRTKRGLTQEKLAEIVHYSTNHISKLESARTNPSFELLYEISKALDVEMKELFNFDEYEEPQYIEKEFKEILDSGETSKIQLLYKIYRSINI